MPKMIGYTANCGHWLQIDVSEEACIPLDVYHGQRIPANNPNATIIGVGNKCHRCFPEEYEKEVVYYRKDNTVAIRPLEENERLIIK